ncbi:MAG: hypothetical protein JWM34_366 [Ilumatobacteraceae bacterium]|nr:hypothetical protein [Ilumatobacteraceae bacterium]
MTAMSTTTDTPTTNPTALGPTTGVPALPDPRPNFTRAVAIARTTIAGVRPDQLDGPTPCHGYDVHTLVGHLVAVMHRVAVVGAGGDPFSVPQAVTGVADDAWAEEFDRYAALVAEVWSDDSVLTNILTLPWAQLPGVIALMIYTSEVSVHTWDLAIATGQQPAWETPVLDMALGAMQRGLPGEGRMESFGVVDGNTDGIAIPFRDVVPTGPDATPIERLVAWCGRDPQAIPERAA